MAKVKIMKTFILILRKFFKCTLIILLCSHWAYNVHCETENPPISNDQEATIGCPIPDLRFVRAKAFLSTTESYSVSLETTQAPNEILSTSNVAPEHHVEDARLTEEGAHTSSLRQTRYIDYNPYAWNTENGDQLHLPGNSDAHLDEAPPNENGERVKRFLHRTKTKRRSKHHSHVHKHNNERNIKHNDIDDAYDSVHASQKDYQHFDNNGTNLEPLIQPININNDNESTVSMIFGLHDNGLLYGQDRTMNQHGDNSVSYRKTDGDDALRITFVHKSGRIIHKIALQRAQSTDIIGHNENDNITDINSGNENKFNEMFANQMLNENKKQNVNEPSMDVIADVSEFVQTSNQNNRNNAETLQLARVKRKSGKATGALSRPKGGSDSGSKSTSRKKDAGYDEEAGLYVPVHGHGPEETYEESEEEESEEDESIHFDEITEVHFPGEIGPIGDRRLCKIRCVKGKWVGPLCTSGEDGDHGNTRFQPLYKSCNVNRIPSHLLLSYKNISVNVGWDVPHGHSLQARCKDLGLYKLLGESRVLCSNGLWAPRMPSCVPTTLLTNFSDDSPPSIRIKVGSGSGAFEPSGVLAVLPGSTVYLDCMYLKRKGTPEWTWTGWHRTYQTGWHITPDEKPSKFRLTIKDIQQQESGTYTCASPRGNTNSIQLIVTISNCQEPPAPKPPMILRLEGLKLGLRALYSCPIGYSIDGIANSTCLASGNWSSPPPVCNPVQCPSLYLEDPHLSMTELNTSAWGRAGFKCSWGYKLNGPPSLECESSGIWSGPVPRCRAIQCAQPILPINGRIDGTSAAAVHRKYAVGALITFSCNEGFLLSGEASIVCTETGFWSHPTPLCKSQCPYPGDPPNGLIAPLKFHYDPGDSLSVQCRPGFVEYGPPERPKCLPDGNWSGPVPQCRNYEEV